MLQVQVFGEPELEDRIERGESHRRCLISIGNPRSLFGPERPGRTVPRVFRRSFDKLLRLSFYDADSVGQLGAMRPKRVAERRDVEKVLGFFEETKSWTDGWTVHCWQGLSRSPAVALGLLYLIHGDEEAAARELLRIRPEARPLRSIVGYFDELLGSRLQAVNERITSERIAEMRREIGLDPDMLLEELPDGE